jgi:hypothetical protein
MTPFYPFKFLFYYKTTPKTFTKTQLENVVFDEN